MRQCSKWAGKHLLSANHICWEPVMRMVAADFGRPPLLPSFSFLWNGGMRTSGGSNCLAQARSRSLAASKSKPSLNKMYMSHAFSDRKMPSGKRCRPSSAAMLMGWTCGMYLGSNAKWSVLMPSALYAAAISAGVVSGLRSLVRRASSVGQSRTAKAGETRVHLAALAEPYWRGLRRKENGRYAHGCLESKSQLPQNL